MSLIGPAGFTVVDEIGATGKQYEEAGAIAGFMPAIIKGKDM